MRKKLMPRVFVYLLGVAVLLTLGLRFQVSSTKDDSPSTQDLYLQQSLSPISTRFILSPKSGKIADVMKGTQVVGEILAEPQSASTPKPKQVNEVHIAAVPKVANTYEVTSYYLNVRANAYNKSKIINVIKKGTLLEITETTKNGWLRIKGGGYVHGDYAKAIAPEPIVDQNAEDLQVIAPTEIVDTIESSGSQEPDQPTSAVRTESGLSEADIALIFDGTALAGNGLEETILEVEEQYGINAFFTIAVMKLESGNGSSRLAKNKNNLFGLNASGDNAHKNAYSFETKGDSVRKFGQLLSKNYVGKGYTTVEKIATKYCPVNSKWSGLVKNIMQKDYGKLGVI
ncbi:glucosaminidase domain-containing protein [Cohnella abietis]|uniref:Mannosyl-glycoprotein endo-beta-N-acetylglucosamidase-like domain-containing protein n=1 Tax=Cohnella abietis TaxID=2507935 RepID=A0A3T1D811_9BACL|nr:glucosaminidase domain-containing protein [Cohnella abietis]BBI34208.1 hypothetical protein KCTCHS21_36070 [Cohnella abietis]